MSKNEGEYVVGPASSSLLMLSAGHRSDTSSCNTKPIDCAEGQKEGQLSATTTIEVCQGPDCFGSGGGAAILELEDLANHYSYIATGSSVSVTTTTSSSLNVIAGGCRNFCTMGPNVHLYDGQGNHQHHFTKIQSTQACYTVMDHIVAEHHQKRHDSRGNCATAEIDDNGRKITRDVKSSLEHPNKNNDGIMMQRAAKKRWAFLRKVARAKAMHQSNNSQRKLKRNIADLLDELEGVIAAEVNAARGNVDVVERAARRKQHLETTLKNVLVIKASKGVQ